MTEPTERAEEDGAQDRQLIVAAGDAHPVRGEVVGPASALERLGAGPLARPALAAAGGFLVGFVSLLAARILRGPGGRRLMARRRRRSLERQIESSRTFLVDVHLLKR
jgi:hypothetical protein